MSAIRWFLVVLAIVGIFLFLYGANSYDPVVGWVGVVLTIMGVVGFVVLYVYDEMDERGQKP